MSLTDFFKAFSGDIRDTETDRLKKALTWEHGLHAFVFLSFILAEVLKIIVESFTAFSPFPGWGPETLLLCALAILTIQYWWVVFESAAFYGKFLFPNFLLGILESAMFYATASFLRAFYPVSTRQIDYLHQLRMSFLSFGVLVALFIVVDAAKSAGRQIRGLWVRQIVRIAALILCVRGAWQYAPEFDALMLLFLVVFYTAMQELGRRC